MLQYLEDCEVKPASSSELEAVWQLAWTKHGIIAARASGAVDVVDFANLNVKQSNTDEHELGVVSMTFDINDDTVLTSSMDGALTLWHWAEDGTLAKAARCASVKGTACGEGESRATFPVEAWVSALYPDASMFAAAGEGAHVALFSARPHTFGQGVRCLPYDSSYASYATCLAFSYEGDLLAMGTNTGVVFVWDVHSGEQIACMTDHSQPVRAITFARPSVAYSNHMFVGSDDRTITVHDVEAIRGRASETTVAALQGHRGWILDVQTGGNGRIIASTSTDHVVRLWDLGTSPVECVLTQTQNTPIWSVAWHPDAMEGTREDVGTTRLMAAGHGFITGSDDGHVRLYRSAGTGASADDQK